jgi:oxygen-independent coproporphyrinogen III oxidase
VKRSIQGLVDAVDVTHSQAPTSLYVHIPFCKSRCFYCDFTTYVAPREAVDKYVEDLMVELELLSPLAGSPLKTVFFGGGTPTLLSARHWRKIAEGLHANFQLHPDAEVTVEANPGTVEPAKLEALREAGVNRISYGAQSFNDRLLLAIGRLHDATAVRDSVALAQAAGFERINVDLMFGLPDQTLADVRDSVHALLELGVKHVSAYWLKVEQGTPFAKWQAQGLLTLPGEDEEGDMYDAVCAELERHGFIHYEVSNFAVPGEEARHNLVYWRNEPYLAAGVGAHGYVSGIRYENVKSLADYASHLKAADRPVATQRSVSVQESMEDTMMLGLRLSEGVSRERFFHRHGVEMTDVFGSVINALVSKGLLCWQEDRLCLTPAAWPIANSAFEPFIGALSD